MFTHRHHQTYLRLVASVAPCVRLPARVRSHSFIPGVDAPIMSAATSHKDPSVLNQRLSEYGVQCVHAPTSSSPPPPSSLSSPSALHRRLVALQDFPSGSIILQSTPHAFALLHSLSDLSSPSSPSSPPPSRPRCEWCFQCVGDLPRGSTAAGSTGTGNGMVDKLARCAKCHTMYYCSLSCQKLSWKSWHAFECKHLWSHPGKRTILEKLAPEARVDLVLIGRCVRRRQKEEASESSYMDECIEEEKKGSPLFSTHADLIGMESHYEFIQRAIDQHQNSDGSSSSSSSSSSKSDSSLPPIELPESVVLSMAQRLTDNTQLLAIGFQLGIFGEKVTSNHVNTILLPLLTAFQTNNFAITNSLLNPIGAAIYPLGAILNHSCDPNCVIVYEERVKGEKLDRRGNEYLLDTPEYILNHPVTPTARTYPSTVHHIQTIRTIKPIKKGDELTHSYIDMAAVTAKRRHALYDRYYFHCECTRCVRDTSTPVPITAFEKFLECDIDGHPVPESLLSFDPAAEQSNSSSASFSSSIPNFRSKELLRANKMWYEATTIHLQPNDATTDAAYDQEEARRNKQEQVLISSALQIRLAHLHPYNLQLLSTYSKLVHIALLNSDFDAAIHACDILCRKYRIIYGSEAIKRAEMEKIEQRKQTRSTPAATSTTTGTDSTTADPVDDVEDVSYISDYPLDSFPAHPLLGLQLYTLASLYEQLLQHDLALKIFHICFQLLQITHGTNHDLVKRLRQEIQHIAQNNRSIITK